MGISKIQKDNVGSEMSDGGDFNDIKNRKEKQGGNERLESSFLVFKNFIAEMEMGDLKYKGDPFTWANNREGEGFIQERLDRFFGSTEWMIQCETIEVRHIFRQTSDHSMLILDSKANRIKTG